MKCEVCFIPIQARRFLNPGALSAEFLAALRRVHDGVKQVHTLLELLVFEVVLADLAQRAVEGGLFRPAEQLQVDQQVLLLFVSFVAGEVQNFRLALVPLHGLSGLVFEGDHGPIRFLFFSKAWLLFVSDRKYRLLRVGVVEEELLVELNRPVSQESQQLLPL